MADFPTMLQMLWNTQRRFTPRRWRLFACGCARRTDGASRSPLREVLETVERYADGEASAHELAAARFGTRHRTEGLAALLAWDPDMPAWDMVLRLLHWLAGDGTGVLLRSAPEVFADLHGPEPDPPSPALLAWESGIVPRLAQGIYDARAWDRMPILGDALEEAGCVQEDVLSHCRNPGSHSRGCWVVDWLLSKS